MDAIGNLEEIGSLAEEIVNDAAHGASAEKLIVKLRKIESLVEPLRGYKLPGVGSIRSNAIVAQRLLIAGINKSTELEQLLHVMADTRNAATEAITILRKLYPH